MEEWLAAPEHARWIELATSIGLRLIGALLLLAIGMRLAAIIADWIGRLLGRTHVERTAALFLARVAQVVLLLAAIQLLGVPMTSTLAMLGAAGLAIGLALKDSLSLYWPTNWPKAASISAFAATSRTRTTSRPVANWPNA